MPGTVLSDSMDINILQEFSFSKGDSDNKHINSVHYIVCWKMVNAMENKIKHSKGGWECRGHSRGLDILKRVSK